MATNLVYWDSVLFIQRINEEPEPFAVLKSITNAAIAGDLFIVTSALTLVEVVKAGKGTTEQQEKIIHAFFENPYILVRLVDRFIATLARQIYRLYPGIKHRDSVHVATAIMTPSLKIMHTFDKELINKTGKLPETDLKIVAPTLMRSSTVVLPPQTESLFPDDPFPVKPENAKPN